MHTISRRITDHVLLLTLVMSVSLSSVAAGQFNEYHVPGDFPTIQDAINYALSGDEIVVAPGTYPEAIDFLGKDLHVHSSGGWDTTIIDAGYPVFASVVTFMNGETSAAVLEGFTLTGGTGTDYTGHGTTFGGGIIIDSSAPTVVDCLVAGNWAVWGSGVAVVNGSDPELNWCEIRGNGCDDSGGGIMLADSLLAVRDCQILNNTTAMPASQGGGVYASSDSWLLLSKSTIAGNRSEYGGGLSSGATLTAFNCFIESNTARNSAGGAEVYGPSSTFVNCQFYDNSADWGWGGGAQALAGEFELINCTVSENRAEYDGAGVSIEGRTVAALDNSVLWGNGTRLDWDDLYVENPAAVWIQYCDIRRCGGSGSGWDSDMGNDGGGNIDSTPHFTDSGTGDFRLLPDSPCIDSGNNFIVPRDMADLDEDGDRAERAPLDILLSKRFVDSPLVADTGVGNMPIVDMGAHESRTGFPLLDVSPEPLVPGDFGRFQVENGIPSSNIYLAYSLRGTGSTWVPFLNVTLDLESPKQGGNTLFTDDLGRAQWNLRVPLNGSSHDVWLQTCQQGSKSNLVATSIQ